MGNCMSEPPGLSRWEAAALINKVTALENKLALFTKDSDAFQDKLLTKMLAEKREEVTEEMSELHDIVINLQAAKAASAAALKSLSEAKSELKSPSCIRLQIDEPFTVTQLSFATFTGSIGTTWLEISPLNGKPYQMSEQMKTGCFCLVHPGDVVTVHASEAPRVNSLWLSGPPAGSAIGYVVLVQ